MTLSVGSLGALLAAEAAQAVPAAVSATVVQAALAFAGGRVVAGAASGQATALAKGMLSGLLWKRVWLGVGVLLLTSLGGFAAYTAALAPNKAVLPPPNAVLPPPPDRGAAPPDQPPVFAVVAGGGALTMEDLKRFQQLPPAIHVVPLRFFRQEIQHQQKTYATRLVATTADYDKANRFYMAAGRFLEDKDNDPPDQADNERLRKVLVLGASAAEELFPSEELKHVVGKTVTLNKEVYKVVGVIKQRPPQEADGQAEDFNKDIYIPIAPFRDGIIRPGGKRTAEQVVFDQIIIVVSDPSHLQPVAYVIREMHKQHHIKQDWEVTVRLPRD
jgi:hypothetical protein